MEMHQLRYFAAVVDEGTFTGAAHRLHVSQSGVSTQVAKLERELGHALFDRSGRQVRLTPAGEAVLPLAKSALATLDAIRHTAAEFADAVRGRVRLGMVMGCSIPPFLDTLADLGRSHPGIELGLHEGHSDALQAQVLSGSLDLALIGFAGEAATGLEADIVTDEPIAAVVPAGHPLDRTELPLTALRGEKVLCLPPGTGIRAAYEDSCRRAGLDPRVDLEASSPAALLRLAERGAGVAVLSASSARAAGLRAVPLADAATHARLGLVTRPDQHSPAVRLLRTRLLAALRAG
ncbi:DNA-binding transcriptional LysR family regulator [Streptomyces sp. 3211.6]|uniref:LysR family transcriptional regulator n=1 Tax=Streptomyces TaxID=1883 RepID=UPI0009A48D25|nr:MULTISPECIES: LysR family transcriptional regulator [Streptomyces]RKT04444.1 DNA-binding transcriptional LysR family regulator [Streptomyces sp. 3211.6]RPF40329.1 DNA-binding transcriptional LysR family regulator [Streptomyces sp. Ag109_G2-6]